MEEVACISSNLTSTHIQYYLSMCLTVQAVSPLHNTYMKTTIHNQLNLNSWQKNVYSCLNIFKLINSVTED